MSDCDIGAGYSITSSASASRFAGTLIPRTFALLTYINLRNSSRWNKLNSPVPAFPPSRVLKGELAPYSRGVAIQWQTRRKRRSQGGKRRSG